MKHQFLIVETRTKTVEIDSDSVEGARLEVERLYSNGEFDLDRNCFGTVEFLRCCHRCRRTNEEGEFYMRTINKGSSQEYVLCDVCIYEAEDSGELTHCECCNSIFSPSLLKINLLTGLHEICPMCGEVWHEQVSR